MYFSHPWDEAVDEADKGRKMICGSQFAPTDVGGATPLEGSIGQVAKDKDADQGQVGKRKVGEVEAPERAVQVVEEKIMKQARIDKRVGFNKVALVKGRRGTLGEDVKSQRPVRSSARKEEGCYWENPVREERFKCKHCKASFSAVSKRRRLFCINLHIEDSD